MIELHKPLTTELTDLIARLGSLILRDEGLTAEEVRDLRDFLKSARSLHHAELRAARIAGVSLRQGGTVVPLSRFARVERVMAGEGEGAA